MPEVYVSTDIETDGPIPGPNSLLSLGSAAYRPDKTLVATFEANLHLLPGASGNPETMAWWRTHKVFDDAIGQGALFCGMLAPNRERHRTKT